MIFAYITIYNKFHKYRTELTHLLFAFPFNHQKNISIHQYQPQY